MNAKDKVKIFFPWKWILAAIVVTIAGIAAINATIGIPDENSAMIGESAGKIIVSVWIITSACKLIAYKRKQK